MLEGNTDYAVDFGQLTKRDGAFIVGRTQNDSFDWSGMENSEVIVGRKGGVPAMTLEHILREKGYINGENITLNFDVSFNLMGPAFDGGTGDYVALFEPTASEMEKLGKGYVLASIGQESGEIPYTAFMASKSYIANNQDIILKFLSAVQKGIDYTYNADSTEIATVIEPQFAGTEIEQLKTAIESYRAIDAWNSTPVMKEEAFNRLQDIMTEMGELSQRVDFSKLVDNSYALQVSASKNA